MKSKIQSTNLSEYARRSSLGEPYVDNAYYEKSKIAEKEMMRDKDYEEALRKFMEKHEAIE